MKLVMSVYIVVLPSTLSRLADEFVTNVVIISLTYICTLSGRTGGYPDDDFRIKKKKKKKKEKASKLYKMVLLR